MTVLYFALTICAYLAAAVSGTTGFGGALIFLSILTLAVDPKSAVPILTIAQLFGNGSRAYFGRNDIEWNAVWRFSAGSVPGAVAGSFLFVETPSLVTTRLIGAFMIAFVFIRRTRFGQRPFPKQFLFAAGILLGFLSAMLGSVGTLQGVVFLGLGLPVGAFVASEAVVATFMHLTKVLIYGRCSLLTRPDVLMGCGFGMAMICGSLTGRKMIERLNGWTLQRVIEVTMLVSGVLLLARA